MRPVRLNRALLLEAPRRAPDGSGGFERGWTALGTLWASVEARSGRDLDGMGAALSRVRLRIVTRAAPPGSTMRPAPEQRFREGARIFAIRAVRELDAEGRYLLCEAEEEVAR
ncbi:head-tail adaptor [Limimaricola soesokkakensis]|uniref:Head-tail adaptor n=1 Tax=Limimaricola soesokkakensis TaxID=1343159 RepID=A0A1X6ZVK0_9RHOB|nr:head-tail adaptor protein [Limimaricola soesokkakensis]PSK83014.1 head-tail adaptor [Limimaricola soesokkakensis]SLN62320.1 Phage head-tail joining protein [Limimaricola soesokkakensis]